jgi:hypothetical protein
VTGTTAGYANDLPDPCGTEGAPDVVYSFTAAGPGGGPYQYVDITTCNSPIKNDTKIWVLESDGLTPVACNDDACTGYNSTLLAVPLVDGELYYIVIGGYDAASFGDYTLDITAGPDPFDCAIGDTPEGEACGLDVNGATTPGSIADGETICGTLWAEGGARDGDFFHYTVTAPLGEELTFTATSDFAPGASWYIMLMNSAATAYYDYSIAGPFETTAIESFFAPPGTYTIRITPNLGTANQYGYDCGTNGADVVDGNYRYKLSLDAYVPSPVDDCSLAGQVQCNIETDPPVVVPIDLTTATPGGSLVGFGANHWYEVTSPTGQSGIVTAELCWDPIPGGVDLVGMATAPACGEGATGLVYNNGFAPVDCGADGPMVTTFPVLDGESAIIEVACLFGGAYTGTLTLSFQQLYAANDYCADAMDLGTGDVAPFFVHNFDANADGAYSPNYGTTIASTRCDDGNANGNALGADVWYTWTASQTGVAVINTCYDPGWDGKLEIFLGTDCLNTNSRLPIACGDDDCVREGAGVMPEVEFNTTAGQSYLIRLGGWFAPPDYPVASQGTGGMDITEYATSPFTRPVNDLCADVPATLLVAGVPEVRYGTLDFASNHDCLYLPPTAWEAFSLFDCQDVDISYEPTADVSADNNAYAADELLLTDCPCYDGLIIVRSAVTAAGGYKTLSFNSLTPGSYYFPVLPGFANGPDATVPGTGVYGIEISGSSIACTYCDAGTNVLACPASGASWIESVSFSNLSTPVSGCDGYVDNTALTADVYQGLTYTLTVTCQKNGLLTDADEVWAYFDFGQDYSFFQSGETFALTRSGRTYTANITIPYGVYGPGEGPSGETIFRVRLINVDAADGLAQACGTQNFGEVEDYVANITALECGDFDNSGGVDGADVTFLTDYYFNPAAAAPDLLARADVNADCVVNIADIVFLADFATGRRVDPLVCLPCTPIP